MSQVNTQYLVGLIAVTTFASTLIGGAVALRATTHVGMIIALGAGVRIGAAFFDLAPESARELESLDSAMLWAGVGFLAFYILERLTLLHVGHEHGQVLDRHEHVGVLGAGGMSVHSLLDGVAIGAAFHAGTEIGVLVAVVVVLHDFSDGIGTVSVLIANAASRRTAIRWLVVDAAAPMLGALLTFALTIEGPVLGALLGIFVGFFLYVGGAELLPEAHRKERSGWVMIATIFGAMFIYGATRLVQI
ncbi:MAG TPA: ZIP family metal transporter [Candidatus Limnocylindria bacterium]|nr:ZIP family metal transporter [Candidatus Limnocylindria bacterium]